MPITMVRNTTGAMIIFTNLDEQVAERLEIFAHPSVFRDGDLLGQRLQRVWIEDWLAGSVEDGSAGPERIERAEDSARQDGEQDLEIQLGRRDPCAAGLPPARRLRPSVSLRPGTARQPVAARIVWFPYSNGAGAMRQPLRRPIVGTSGGCRPADRPDCVYFAGRRPGRWISIGAATKIDEYVPMMMPNMIEIGEAEQDGAAKERHDAGGQHCRERRS